MENSRTKKTRKPKSGYAIAVIHPDGVVGYLTAPDCSVEIYSTEAAAAASLEEKRKDTRYTWSLPMEVRKYDPRKDDVLEEENAEAT